MKPNKPAAPTPPPGGNIENRKPPSEPSAPARQGEPSTSDEGTVNYTALRMLQTILDDYSDVSKLEKNEQADLSSRLRDAGFLKPGALIDVSA
jgi:hypothetical protein